MTRIGSGEAVFRLDRATVRYGEATVLDGITFDIRPGERIAVIGPNGSGKSTLLRVLAGLIEPTVGSALYQGAPVARMAPSQRAQRIAYVPQDTSVPFEFSIRDIVAMGRSPYLSPWGFESREDEAAIDEAIDLMELGPFEDRSILDVSGGERQRTVIARALAQNPSVLLLDEPGANLDLRHQVALHHLLTRLNHAAGLTTVTVSHDLNAVAASNRVVALAGGCVRAIGTPDRVLTEALIGEIFDCRAVVDSHPRTGQVRITVDWSAP